MINRDQVWEHRTEYFIQHRPQRKIAKPSLKGPFRTAVELFWHLQTTSNGTSERTRLLNWEHNCCFISQMDTGEKNFHSEDAIVVLHPAKRWPPSPPQSPLRRQLSQQFKSSSYPLLQKWPWHQTCLVRGGHKPGSRCFRPHLCVLTTHPCTVYLPSGLAKVRVSAAGGKVCKATAIRKMTPNTRQMLRSWKKNWIIVGFQDHPKWDWTRGGLTMKKYSAFLICCGMVWNH